MKVKLCLLLVALAMVIVYFPACAGQTAPPTKGEIVIGILEDVSGPMGANGVQLKDGELDAVRYINEKKGGINGYKIRTVVSDFKMDPTLALEGWQRLKTEGAPAIVSFYGAALPNLHKQSLTDQIPMLCSLLPPGQCFPTQENPNYTFSTAPAAFTRIDFLCWAIEKEWNKQAKGRTPKVGLDFVSVGILPTMMNKKAKMEMEKRGWEYTLTRSPMAPADVTTQVLQMKNFGVDYIYQMGTVAQGVAWLKEIDRQGLKAQIYGDGHIGGDEIWSAVGPPVIGARYTDLNAQWTDTGQPGIDLLHKLNAEWYPEVKSRGNNYIRGFAVMITLADVMKKAMSDVGYEKLNAAAVKKQLELTTNSDPEKFGSLFSWSPTDHQGLHVIRWYEWTKEGTKVPWSDWWTVPTIPMEQRTDAFWTKSD